METGTLHEWLGKSLHETFESAKQSVKAAVKNPTAPYSKKERSLS
ncbi:MAG: hypothetical protein Q8R76_06960 [Candidatus Omnitrophota bacterium]|nr:hypothetical protein [Candidatus Omnitrophota bacterium]